MKLYIAGPMTGLLDYNHSAFIEAAKHLRDVGYEVISPNEHYNGEDWKLAMKVVLPLVIQADGIATLYNWEYSKGAKLEVHIAFELDMIVQSVDNWIKEYKKWRRD